MELKEQVVEFVAKFPNSNARQIAKALGCEKSEVNSPRMVLYRIWRTLGGWGMGVPPGGGGTGMRIRLPACVHTCAQRQETTATRRHALHQPRSVIRLVHVRLPGIGERCDGQ